MTKPSIFFWVWFVVIILIIGGIYWSTSSQANKPGELDLFAQCLKDKGATFYGTFWCPHCQNQKKLFGRSARLLPYVECSTPNGQGQLPVCQEKKIEGYPTWEFADGSREGGEVKLETLAEKTGCLLPGATTGTVTAPAATTTTITATTTQS